MRYLSHRPNCTDKKNEPTSVTNRSLSRVTDGKYISGFVRCTCLLLDATNQRKHEDILTYRCSICSKNFSLTTLNKRFKSILVLYTIFSSSNFLLEAFCNIVITFAKIFSCYSVDITFVTYTTISTNNYKQTEIDQNFKLLT